MKKVNKLVSFFLVVFLVFSSYSIAGAKSVVNNDKNFTPDISKALMGFFTENNGQWNNEIIFVGKTPFGRIGFGRESIYYELIKFHRVEEISNEVLNPEPEIERYVIKQSFKNSNLVSPEGSDLLSHLTNYFYGNDPSKWIKGAKNYSKVVYKNIYDNIDLSYFYNEDGLKYEFYLKKGAKVSDIKVAIEGADIINNDKTLELKTSLGSISDSGLFSFKPTSKEKIDTDFELYSENVYGFDFNNYNIYTNGDEVSEDIVIDPLIYSTFLGGSSSEYGYGIAVDSSGCAYVTGYTYSSDFPTTVGAWDSTYNNIEVFVTKFNSAGTALLYSTFLGGTSYDYGRGIAIDSSGCAYVTGYTQSTDFPTTVGAWDSTYNNIEVFVTKFNAAGTALLYSTFLGGTSSDYGYGIAVDSSGCAYVTGYTSSSNFPTTVGAWDTIYNNTDVFVTKFDLTTSLSYSTFLGGSSSEYCYAIAVDSSGCAYVTGYTYSSDFPTTPGAYDTIYNSYDVFVTKFNSAGTALLYSTYLGGNSSEYGYGIAVDSSGCAYVTGYTYSSDFPTTVGAWDTTYYNGDVFVTKFNSAGTALLYSTYLGGSSSEYGYGIAVDSSGCAYVTGYTYSSDFPTTVGAWDTSYYNTDLFVTKFNSAGTALLYSTFLGGTSYEYNSQYGASQIAVDSSGCAYVTGYTQSSDFPITSGAYDSTFNGSTDVFVTKFNSGGTALVYSTYLGGSSSDYPYGGIAVDSSGCAYVMGYTNSSNFPTTPGAWDTSYYNTDLFVTKFNSAGTALVYSTFLGGSSSEYGYGGIAVDSSGCAYVTGYTSSTDFPITSGAIGSYSNGDVFITEINVTGTSLNYSTYLGGSSSEYPYGGIAADSRGNIWVAGYTNSTNFPTTVGAWDRTYYNGDVFVSKLKIYTLGPPQNLQANTSSLPYQINLLWDPPSISTYPIYAYRIYRSTISGFINAIFIGEVDSSTLTYSDTNILPHVTYYYYVVAIDNKMHSSPPSNEVSVPSPSVIVPPPQNLTANHNPTELKIDLSWEAPASLFPIAIYKIYRGTSPGFSIATLIDEVDGSTLTYSDTDILPTITYYYYVVAIDIYDYVSAPSNEASATYPPIFVDPPQNVTATPNVELNRIVITWSWEIPAQNSYFPLGGFRIYKAPTSDFSQARLIGEVSESEFTFADTSVAKGIYYFYYVVAVDIYGFKSDPSNEAVGILTTVTSPRNLTAIYDKMNNFIKLTWEPPGESTRLMGYKVYKGTIPGFGNASVIADLSKDNLAYNDSDVVAGVVYYYYIVAYNYYSDLSAPSNEAIGVIPILSPPQNLTATPDTEGVVIVLQWKPPAESTLPVRGYKIYRNLFSDFNSASLIGTVRSFNLAYVDFSVEADVRYYYYVVAFDNFDNNSPPSNEASAIVTATIADPVLYVSPEVNREEYNPGDEVIIKVSVMNKGGSTATNVKLVMTLPQDIEYVKADLLRGSVFGRNVEFSIGNIPKGETVTFNIFCQINKNIRNDKSVDIIFDVTCKEGSTDRRAVHLLIKPKRGEVMPLSIGVYLKNIKSDPDTGEAYIDFDTSLELTVRIDGGNAPYTLKIDWGDGSSKEEKKVDAAEINLTHKFESRGTIEIKFEVIDSVGRSKKATVKLKVK